MRLGSVAYRALALQVLARDGWCCKRCGGLTELQVHHIQPRSQLGSDNPTNLITLCARCHREIHLHTT
ncbi:MAG: HNH endonuclease [Chloroflexota bacterium]